MAYANKSYKKLNSKIPVLSKAYKQKIRQKNEKKETLEKECARVEVLKRKLEEFKPVLEAASNSTVSATTTFSPYSKSNVRAVIITPKGTKRKVRPSLVRFQGKLEDILEEHVLSKPGEMLPVDELIKRLHRYDWLKAMGKRQLLIEVSKKLNSTVTYKGRDKKGYYNGFCLINSNLDDSQDTETGDFASATHKELQRNAKTSRQENIPMTVHPDCSDENYRPACRTRLPFQETINQSESALRIEPEHLMEIQAPDELPNSGINQDVNIQLKTQVENLTLQNNALSKQLSDIQESFNKYVALSSDIVNQQDSVIELYKDILHSSVGVQLSISERNVIRQEITEAQKIFELGLRGDNVKDLLQVLHPSMFKEMLSKLKSNCPTITSVLEQLVLSPNASRNSIKTPEMKMKAAVHLLASLMDVRNQHAHNDVTILFGLLCLCFGAGPSMINLLQRLGLSESYPVLLKILKFQIQHYREIIEQRFVEGWPVVTFQDNMQLMRTSMRHLRLSKLQKDKAKQNKMWDFTVRGWRVADITGLEELFQSKTFAAESQKSVKELTSDDFLIENNKDHLKKWEDFKMRNTLRKMEVAFNAVPACKEGLGCMSNEELQQVACSTTSKDDKKVKVVIPEVPCEFPDMAEKEAKIYPLPISHENQCTTLGVASNLDLFQEEFKFDSKKEERYLPLKSSKKEFDIDLAYKRFSFLKKIEQHKKKQQVYENFLRGCEQATNNEHNPVTGENVGEKDDCEVLQIVNEDSESDELSD